MHHVGFLTVQEDLSPIIRAQYWPTDIDTVDAEIEVAMPLSDVLEELAAVHPGLEQSAVTSGHVFESFSVSDDSSRKRVDVSALGIRFEGDLCVICLSLVEAAW